jgi:hypothetical protein
MTSTGTIQYPRRRQEPSSDGTERIGAGDLTHPPREQPGQEFRFAT